jgi:hypothetical protein
VPPGARRNQPSLAKSTTLHDCLRELHHSSPPACAVRPEHWPLADRVCSVHCPRSLIALHTPRCDPRRLSTGDAGDLPCRLKRTATTTEYLHRLTATGARCQRATSFAVRPCARSLDRGM